MSDPSDGPPPVGEWGDGIAAMLSRGSDVEILECDKTGNIRQRLVHKADGCVELTSQDSKSKNYLFRSLHGWRQAVLDSFLPVGYPHSVSDDYLAYQFYDSLQAFFSTITSLLASRALLEGLGVGDANSSATFAMLLTILNDATSRIATIGFAHRFGLRIEPDAKRYRFLADLFNDTKFFLELYSPYYGAYGKILALSTGQALGALCGVAAGASKAALSVHFAKHDNLAELNAKEASQETAVGLVGLLVGTLVVKYIEDHTTVVSLMIALVFAHLWVNYLGVCSVYMTTLNRQRATILYYEYLRTGKVLSPKEVAKRENILFWSPEVVNSLGQKVARIEFAESYQQAAGFPKATHTTHLLDGHESIKFIGTRKSDGFTTIRILLWNGTDPSRAIMAWFYAMEIAWEMDKGEGYTAKLHSAIQEADAGDMTTGSQFQEHYCNRKLWREMIEVGWDTGSQSFETGAPVRLRVQPATRKDE